MKYLITTTLILIQTVLVWGQKVDSVTVDGITVYYETEGSGAPIYIISGGPGFTPYYMKPITAELSQKYQTVLIHQRGTGQTKVSLNEQTINMDEYVKDIKAIKEKLNHKKITLLGHSWGGMLAMNYAAIHPNEIDKLILVSSGSPDLSFYNFFVDNLHSKLSEDDQYSSQALLRLFGQAEKGIEANQVFLEYQNLLTKAYFYDKSKAKEIGILTAEDFNVAAFNLIFNAMYKENWDIKQKLGGINIHTLIIHGRQDPVGMETPHLINQTIKGSKLSIIEKCGHFPWIEQPDVFFNTINEFIETN